ncbi:SHOCT domain-containing protein [Siphonobacter sp. SORGH_AS_0500]|uniref:SHOCT domain-containing protein n=2 Tax=unclassified Siphonobacter TaxID=2635712 RepID=UPI00285DB348|nr:SHOCT domain-containing protein [Siphonobacter sp. SORGH_AS_0500]MDR6194966.1 membrane protease subunit (stomatin/prohibitin family) [Siphonobacter sp. SORGH_AS_0500]
MARFQQFQAGVSIEKAAENSGAAASIVGMNLGGMMSGAAATPASSGAAQSKEDIMGLLKQLGELKTAGILTEEEFSAKKAELLAKL